MQDLITRSQAQASGLKNYFTGKPCVAGHIALRNTNQKKCVECIDAARIKHKDARLASTRRWHKNNPGQAARWYESHPGVRARLYKRWSSKNSAKLLARNAQYRAQKLQATPPWLTGEHKQQIYMIYKTCPKGWHVDHMEPLQGKNVCGLHVPWNLQHLTAKANQSKSNR